MVLYILTFIFLDSRPEDKSLDRMVANSALASLVTDSPLSSCTVVIGIILAYVSSGEHYLKCLIFYVSFRGIAPVGRAGWRSDL
jgi:hypothetical protein